MEDVAYAADEGYEEIDEDDEEEELEYGDEEMGSDHTSETSRDDDDEDDIAGDLDVISESSHAHPWNANAEDEDDGEEVDGEVNEAGEIVGEMDQDEEMWEVSCRFRLCTLQLVDGLRRTKRTRWGMWLTASLSISMTMWMSKSKVSLPSNAPMLRF